MRRTEWFLNAKDEKWYMLANPLRQTHAESQPSGNVELTPPPLPDQQPRLAARARAQAPLLLAW